MHSTLNLLESIPSSILEERNLYETEQLSKKFTIFLQKNNVFNKEEIEQGLKLVFCKLNIKIKPFFNEKDLCEEYKGYLQSEISRLCLKKRNWNKIEAKILVFLVCFLSNFSLQKITNFDENDWKEITDFFPRFTWESCKLKWGSLQRCQILKTPWKKTEDDMILHIIDKNKSGKNKYRWTKIAKLLNESFYKGEMVRISKHCRERWLNHLNPSLNKGRFLLEEDLKIFEFISQKGKKWAEISRKLINRNSNTIKTRYFSYIKSKKFRKVLNINGFEESNSEKIVLNEIIKYIKKRIGINIEEEIIKNEPKKEENQVFPPKNQENTIYLNNNEQNNLVFNLQKEEFLRNMYFMNMFMMKNAFFRSNMFGNTFLF